MKRGPKPGNARGRPGARSPLGHLDSEIVRFARDYATLSADEVALRRKALRQRVQRLLAAVKRS